MSDGKNRQVLEEFLEIWAYVGCHDKHKERKGITDENQGSKWCYVALERNTKMITATR